MTTPVTQTTSQASGANSPGSLMNATFDKNLFLNMLVAQLKNQNPMQPTDDQQWIGQMAQFSEVEQVSNMASSEAKVATALGASETVSLIGRTVTYVDANGASQQGVVDKVDITGGTPTLDVAGQSGIGPASVTEVQ